MSARLLPTIPKGDLPWTIGLTSLVTAFVHHQVQGLAPGTGLAPGPGLAPGTGTGTGTGLSSYPQVFLKEDVERIFSALLDDHTDGGQNNPDNNNNNNNNININNNNNKDNNNDQNQHQKKDKDKKKDKDNDNDKKDDPIETTTTDNNDIHTSTSTNNNPSTPLSSLICFDRLVIAGTLDLSLPFVATTSEALAFRAFAYSFLQLTATTDDESKGGVGGVGGGTGVGKVSPSLPNFHPNDLIRVTIILRPDTRKILNMAALGSYIIPTQPILPH